MSAVDMRKVLAAFLTHCPDAYIITEPDTERQVVQLALQCTEMINLTYRDEPKRQKTQSSAKPEVHTTYAYMRNMFVRKRYTSAA